MTTLSAEVPVAGNPAISEEEQDTLKDKYLTFHIGNEDYGISIRFVTEIIGMQKITEVPETPVYIKGVINLRGKVIPVMDIRLRFNMDARAYDERTCVIVVNHNDIAVGLVVDTVSEVVDIPSGSIEPSPVFNTAKGHFIEGMGKIADEIKMLVEINRLLYDDATKLEELEQRHPENK